MTRAAFLIDSYVINAAWQVCLIGAAGWVISRITARLGSQFQHALWVVVLGLCTFVPLTSLFLPYWRQFPVPGRLGTHAPIAWIPAISTRQSADIILPLSLMRVLADFYIVMLGLLVLRLCCLFSLTARLVRSAKPATLTHEQRQLWEFSARLFVVEKASVLCSHGVLSPAAAGLWRPVLVVPPRFVKEASSQEFLAAVGHECAHLTRHDFQKNLCYEVLLLFTWFHPVAWVIKSHLTKTREMICDRMAAEKLMCRQTYTNALIRLAATLAHVGPRLNFPTVEMFAANTLEERILMLQANTQRVNFMLRYCLTISALVVLLLVATGTLALTRSVTAQTFSEPSHADHQAGPNKPDLSCTYYDPQSRPHEGTCGLDKRTKEYLCFSNENRSLSELQIGCESKVRRATRRSSASQ